LLAFACEEVIAQVTGRLMALKTSPDIRDAVAEVLLETMPVDEERRIEAALSFAEHPLGRTGSPLTASCGAG
jgi:hypothetical protein